MMVDGIGRQYTGLGITQMVPGTRSSARQEPLVGHVILCIDVSASMASVSGGRSRLQHAVAGAERFVEDAIRLRYQVGLILWSHEVRASVPVSADPTSLLQTLRDASTNGGSNIVPALLHGMQQLNALSGDRVLAIFGDGDLGDENEAVATAQRVFASDIRIIVRSLGEFAGARLNLIASSPGDPYGDALITDARGIEGAIASMAEDLRVPGSDGR